MKTRGINKGDRATHTIARPITSSRRSQSSATGRCRPPAAWRTDKDGAIPEHQLDPVGALRPEHVDRPGKWIRRHRLAHQCRQSLGAFAEVDRFGRHHHADRAGRADHVPSFNARSTAVTVFASAPRPTRTVTPSISTSIIPAPGSTWRRGILR